MLITLYRRTAICQSVSEVYLTGVAPLGAVSHRFNLIFLKLLYKAFFITLLLGTYKPMCRSGLTSIWITDTLRASLEENLAG